MRRGAETRSGLQEEVSPNPLCHQDQRQPLLCPGQTCPSSQPQRTCEPPWAQDTSIVAVSSGTVSVVQAILWAGTEGTTGDTQGLCLAPVSLCPEPAQAGRGDVHPYSAKLCLLWNFWEPAALLHPFIII